MIFSYSHMPCTRPSTMHLVVDDPVLAKIREFSLLTGLQATDEMPVHATR